MVSENVCETLFVQKLSVCYFVIVKLHKNIIENSFSYYIKKNTTDSEQVS